MIFFKTNGFYGIAKDNKEHETKITHLKIAYTSTTNIPSFDTYTVLNNQKKSGNTC